MLVSLSAAEQRDAEFERYVRSGFTVLTSLGQYNRNAPVDVKRRILSSILTENVYSGKDFQTSVLTSAFLALISEAQILTAEIGTEDRRPLGRSVRKVGPTGFEPVTSRV